MNTASTIRQFIIENFVFEDGGALADDTPFLESGIMDSTGVLELVSFIEETFGIAVADEDLVPENLDSISLVTRYIDSKRGV
jgi:acyl carrier protein